MSNCVVCTTLIFHFERRIKVSELNPGEKLACASVVDTADSHGSQENNEDIVCVHCYNKLQRDSAHHKLQRDSAHHKLQRDSAPHKLLLESGPHQLQQESEEGVDAGVDAGEQKEPPVAANTAAMQPNGMATHDQLLPLFQAAGGIVCVAAGLGLALGGGWMVLGLAGAGVLLVLGVAAVNGQEVRRSLRSGHGQGGGVAAEHSSEAEHAAALAVTSGSSLAGTSTLGLLQDGYRVTCGLEVENWTRCPLVHPHVRLCRGTLTLAPSTVAPATREVMVARKTFGLAEGSYGTVSWLIQPMRRRLVIMWSAPFNFNHYSNWLAVGLTAEGVTDHAPGSAWFQQMYYGDSTRELQFERGEYYGNIRPVFVRDGEFEAEGIMGSDHKAKVKVILRPTDPSNFAGSIKEKMKIV